MWHVVALSDFHERKKGLNSLHPTGVGGPCSDFNIGKYWKIIENIRKSQMSSYEIICHHVSHGLPQHHLQDLAKPCKTLTASHRHSRSTGGFLRSATTCNNRSNHRNIHTYLRATKENILHCFAAMQSTLQGGGPPPFQ